MGTLKYAPPETGFAPRETPTPPGVLTGQRFDEDTTPLSLPRRSSVWEIDFSETRDPLGEGFEESGKEFKIDRRASEISARRPGIRRVGRLEESFYWLFSAAVLGFLLLEIIGR